MHTTLYISNTLSSIDTCKQTIKVSNLDCSLNSRLKQFQKYVCGKIVVNYIKTGEDAFLSRFQIFGNCCYESTSIQLSLFCKPHKLNHSEHLSVASVHFKIFWKTIGYLKWLIQKIQIIETLINLLQVLNLTEN